LPCVSNKHHMVESISVYSFQLCACFRHCCTKCWCLIVRTVRLFLALLYIPTCSAYSVSLLVCLHGVCNKDYACFGTAVQLISVMCWKCVWKSWQNRDVHSLVKQGCEQHIILATQKQRKAKESLRLSATIQGTSQGSSPKSRRVNKGSADVKQSETCMADKLGEGFSHWCEARPSCKAELILLLLL